MLCKTMFFIDEAPWWCCIKKVTEISLYCSLQSKLLSVYCKRRSEWVTVGVMKDTSLLWGCKASCRNSRTLRAKPINSSGIKLPIKPPIWSSDIVELLHIFLCEFIICLRCAYIVFSFCRSWMYSIICIKLFMLHVEFLTLFHVLFEAKTSEDYVYNWEMD